ncbi:MAG: amidase [Alphaproteobacteria bacterium]|nr:amidase [Alphaproteobacteria bacterium]
MTELHYLELTDVARRLHSGEVSPVEVTTAQLARIEALDGTLKSYATLMAEQALAQAKVAEAEIRRGEIRGPLHGVPVAVKDLCWTTGVPTAAGMAIYKNNVPTEDATVVKRLAEGGAVILGKLQLTESAYADHHPSITPPRNPWNAAHWPGASSSGSGVATAAGLCYGSLGSDTGGSIRFPSAANGITGLKPTWGRVSRYGVFELAATLDHVGPMTRSAADAGAMLGVIAGADPNDPTASQEPVPNYLAGARHGIRHLRVGFDPAWNGAVSDAETNAACAAALAAVRSLDPTVKEVKFPDSTQIVIDWPDNCAVETAVAHEATYPARKSEYGAALAGLIETGRALTGLDYQKILLRRNDFRGRVAALFEDIDLLLVPVQPFAAPTLAALGALGEDVEKVRALLRFTCPFDATGNPTITLPCGFTSSGLPIAFQLVARPMEEATLVRAGVAFQSITDWHRQHPAL